MRAEQAVGEEIERTQEGIECGPGRGKGRGNKKVYLGKVDSMNDCLKLVKASEPTANGATYMNTKARKCWAEINQETVISGHGLHDRYQNCWTTAPTFDDIVVKEEAAPVETEAPTEPP